MEDLQSKFYTEFLTEFLYFLGKMALIFVICFYLMMTLDRQYDIYFNNIFVIMGIFAICLYNYFIYVKDIELLERAFIKEFIIEALKTRDQELFNYYNAQYPILFELIYFELMENKKLKETLVLGIPEAIKNKLYNLYKNENVNSENYNKLENIKKIKSIFY
jgi:hypothetical protein